MIRHREFLRPTPRPLVALAVLIAVGAGAGLTVRRHLTSPLATAQAFLACCRTHDYRRMRGLMDASYRQTFTPQASGDLLARLHAYIPGAYAIAMSGYPNAYGTVNDWHRYCVRCQFEAPVEAREAHKCFVITLVQQTSGVWRVAFMPTYRSLLGSLFETTGSQYLQQAVREAAGPGPRELWDPQ